MRSGVIAKKLGMTRLFLEDGKQVPVTVLQLDSLQVVAQRTAERDGYTAVQLGFGDIKEHKLSKPEAGHLKKAGVAPKKYLKEFRLENCDDLNVGDIVKADVFAQGDKVDVTGVSKGKGYAGVIKRYHAQRTPTSPGGRLSPKLRFASCASICCTCSTTATA